MRSIINIKRRRRKKRGNFFVFLHYQLLFDVLSANSIVYLVGDAADLMCNEGNKKISNQNNTYEQQLEKDNDNHLRLIDVS
jgi:hypothetical protein